MVLSSCRNTGSPIATKANKGTPVENGRNLGLHSAMAVSQTASALDFAASYQHRRRCFPTWVQCMKMSSETTPGTPKRNLQIWVKTSAGGLSGCFMGTVKNNSVFQLIALRIVLQIHLFKDPRFCACHIPHAPSRQVLCMQLWVLQESICHNTTTSVDVNMTWCLMPRAGVHMVVSRTSSLCMGSHMPPPFWQSELIQKVTSNLTKSPPSFSEFHCEFHIGLRCWPFQQDSSHDK